MNPMNLLRISLVLAVTALAAILPGISSRAGHVGAASIGPTLTSAHQLTVVPGRVAVTGNGFTPGGRVYIALYDTWGTMLHETRWATASPVQFGINGSVDPALGYRSGGSVFETFDDLCGDSVMIRAFDGQMTVWSNVLSVDAIGARFATFGPNGSMDPARGYRAGC
jgi:hypothetical protein